MKGGVGERQEGRSPGVIKGREAYTGQERAGSGITKVAATWRN